MHSLLHLHLFIETLVTLFGSDGGMQFTRRVIRSKPAVVDAVVAAAALASLEADLLLAMVLIGDNALNEARLVDRHLLGALRVGLSIE